MDRLSVTLPDGHLLPVATTEQERFLNAVIPGTPSRQIPAKQVSAALYEDHYHPHNQSQLRSVSSYYRTLETVAKPLGWLVAHNVSQHQGRQDSYFMQPIAGESGFYPYVSVYGTKDLVDTPEGDTVRALSLARFRAAKSINEIINQVFHESHRGAFKMSTLFSEIYCVVAEHNQVLSQDQWIKPVVIRDINGAARWRLFFNSQRGQVVELLTKNRDRLELVSRVN